MVPIKIITVAKSRELENQANAGGLDFSEMMENAGRQTAEAIHRHALIPGKRVLVLVGPGNNGGDGLVAAHYLQAMGALVTCYLWKRRVKGDANFERIQADGLPVVWAEDDTDFEALQILASKADVIVDALLGVGVSLPIRGDLSGLLEQVRKPFESSPSQNGLLELLPSGRPAARPLVVAVDCPTGLDCDTGEIDPSAVAADLTVTFAYPKRGLLRFPGAEAVGKLLVADIGIPAALAEDVPLELGTAGMVRAWLPERRRSAHKGTFGRVLIVAGSANYVGAAALAAAGAARVGAGLITLGLPGPIQAAVASQVAEATFVLVPHDMGVITSAAVDILHEEVDRYEAFLLGPGLTQEAPTVAFVRAMLGVGQPERKGHIGFVTSAASGEEGHRQLPPLVVDADGLNALSLSQGWWKALPPDTILTPHPGEMARLMGGDITARQVQEDREGVAGRMAAEWRTVVVLKGAFTVIADPDGRLVVLPFANPGLATAGTGDVLSGAIVGLRAQGLGAFEAAVAGAYVHGLAGELAREDLGDMGMVAGDLLMRLPLALRLIREGG
jgi:ADP-dependent NAD(P)H-hydrate dehydratase / NAD(P)H-hydrate epimerase